MAPTDIITFWQTSADDDWSTAETLYTAKKYHHALFFVHLALEKILKGLVYAKTDEHPKPIHNLVILAKQATLTIDNTKEEKLKEITSWNINARYDDYKRKFYQKATEEFTKKWMDAAHTLYIWLKKQY